jgi:hypothetical protein
VVLEVLGLEAMEQMELTTSPLSCSMASKPALLVLALAAAARLESLEQVLRAMVAMVVAPQVAVVAVARNLAAEEQAAREAMGL